MAGFTDIVDKARFLVRSWVYMLSKINPNIIAILLAICLIPIVLLIDRIGQKPPTSAAPSPMGQIVYVDSKGKVRTKEIETRKDK